MFTSRFYSCHHKNLVLARLRFLSFLSEAEILDSDDSVTTGPKNSVPTSQGYCYKRLFLVLEKSGTFFGGGAVRPMSDRREVVNGWRTYHKAFKNFCCPPASASRR